MMMVVTILTRLVSLSCPFPSSPSNGNIDDDVDIVGDVDVEVSVDG